jgi:hypothetical protein
MMNFTFLVLIAFAIFMLVKILTKTIRNERNRRAFASTMKPGDLVKVPVLDDHYVGEVFEVNGDEVKIIVTASKNRVYPKSK